MVGKTEESEGRNSDTESNASDGATATIEAKKRFSSSNLQQVISMCVFSSFTEKFLHPELPAVVPTILIDEKQFRVCLYDCELDFRTCRASHKRGFVTERHDRSLAGNQLQVTLLALHTVLKREEHWPREVEPYVVRFSLFHAGGFFKHYPRSVQRS